MISRCFSLLLCAIFLIASGFTQQTPPAGPASKAPKSQDSNSRHPGPAPVAVSGQTYKATLETSETLFSVLAAINSCGYDQGLAASDAVRTQVREELARAVQAAEPAEEAQKQLCGFYRDHQQGSASRDLAQYISLGLFTQDPPDFATSMPEADLPPDANFVLGFIPLLQNFYKTTNLHDIWQKHALQYGALVGQFHEPVAAMILKTDLYLKLQLSGYLGRRFLIFVEPMQSPDAINARNYGDDYFLVVSPTKGELKLDGIRHTYLHYVLDPYALNRGRSLKRLEPLLLSVSTAPMDESFKNDIGLLVNECLIRAIEVRMMPGGRAADPQREQTVERSVREGFVLTRYFYDTLLKFEKDPAGLKDSYSDWIFQIDLGREKKLAESIDFAKEAAPEVLHATRLQHTQTLDLAEQRLASGDATAAAKMARDSLDAGNEEPARALFILARAAAATGDMPGARSYFERTLDVAREPRMVAWSHIYLGRILDLQEDRDAALRQYHAALSAGDTTPDTKTAAERGLARPYAPPVSRQPN